MRDVELIIGACLFCLTVVAVNIAIHIKTNENAKIRIGFLETWLPMLRDQVDDLERRVKELESKLKRAEKNEKYKSNKRFR